MGLSLSLSLRPTVSQPVCLGMKHPSGAYDQIFVTVTQLRVCWCGALSLMRGRVCHLQLLLALSSAVILGSKSHGTRGHILLSQIRDFLFCRLLQLAGLQWRYSTPPPPPGNWDRMHWVTPIVLQPLCTDQLENTVSNSNSIVVFVSVPMGICLHSIQFIYMP
jgi:hypothetical protein